MIPDFKTYLKESVWMDIHKHSNGDMDRREDDVNNLSPDEFVGYINEHYTGYAAHVTKLNIFYIKLGEYTRAEVYIYFNYQRKILYIYNRYGLFNKMETVFKDGPYFLKRPEGVIYKSQNMEAVVDNRSILDFLDYMIDNMGGVIKNLISRKRESE